MRIRIDRSSPLPLYVQLKQAILDLMAANHWQPGSQLPSEEELVTMTGLSRYTVRQALQELQQDGRIDRVHGRGTFVSEPRVTLSVAGQLLGIYADMASKGHTVESVVLSNQLAPTPADVAEALGIDAGTPAVVIKRLRIVDEQPFLVDIVFIRPEFCPGLEELDLTDASLMQIWENRYGLEVVHAHRTLRVVPAEPWVAELLGTEVGAPLHLLTDLASVESGEAFQVAHTWIHGERSEFVFDLVTTSAVHIQPDVTLTDSINPNLRRNV